MKTKLQVLSITFILLLLLPQISAAQDTLCSIWGITHLLLVSNLMSRLKQQTLKILLGGT